MVRTQHGQDVLEHWRRQKQVHEVWIELHRAPLQDLLCGFFGRPRRAVAAMVRNRVEGIRDADDAGGERNGSAPKLAGVAVAIPALVVREDAAR